MSAPKKSHLTKADVFRTCVKARGVKRTLLAFYNQILVVEKSAVGLYVQLTDGSETSIFI